jgi:hypothetical protein
VSGRRLTLGELFAEREAKARAEYQAHEAWLLTPGGQAYEREQRERYQREQAAQEAYDAAKLAALRVDPWQAGYDARLAGAVDEPPEGLADNEAELWRGGWLMAGGEDE